MTRAEIKELERKGMFVVFSLSTGDYKIYGPMSGPIPALYAAYAQSLGDFDTWDYKEKYYLKGLIRYGNYTASIGDLSVFIA